MGHLQVATGLSDQLIQECAERSRGVLGKGGGSYYSSGYHGPGFFSGGLPLVVCSALFLKLGTTIVPNLRKGHYKLPILASSP